MTQTTDKNRAEFLAWVRTHEECHGAIDEGSAWAAWQAARRAQVVTVGWKLVPVDPTSEMLKAAWKHGVDDEAPEPYYAYKAMLAAAPQPPESNSVEFHQIKQAAPVLMPEPVAMTTIHDGVFLWVNHLASQGRRFGAKLYTEHQVRQILAAHGIK